jgi:hypothetical protein
LSKLDCVDGLGTDERSRDAAGSRSSEARGELGTRKRWPVAIANQKLAEIDTFFAEIDAVWESVEDGFSPFRLPPRPGT